MKLSNEQLDILRWIADGCQARDWPDHTHKISAHALANRGLARIDRYRASVRTKPPSRTSR